LRPVEHSSASLDSTSVVEVGYDYDKEEKTRVSAKYNYYTPTFKAVTPVSRELLYEAFERITDTIDLNLSLSQRSNSFDEWKELLLKIARQTSYFDSNHRKVLGSLISSTAKSDISDFNTQLLKVFIQNTNILRQPRITKPEAKQAISSLLKVNIDPLIPLSVENLDEKQENELDAMMADLIEEEKRVC
jgi:hypothetical protein